MSTVSELIARALAEAGHDTIFGLLGSGNFTFTDAFARDYGGQFVWVRHESAAVAAAATYAQLTGRLGIASVHQGPGVTNTLTTLTHAVRERQPVLVLAGETGRGRRVNQTIDLLAFAAAAGARVLSVSRAPDALPLLRRAIAEAQRYSIPVVLGIPVDIQEENSDWEEPGPPPSPNIPRSRPVAADIEAAADLIQASKKPLILAGRGAVLAESREQLELLGQRIGAIYGTSLVANGFFAGNPESVGVCGGFSSELVPEIVPEADLILAFGATLNQWTTMHGRLIDRSKVVQIDADPFALGLNGPVRLGLAGDAARTAAALSHELERRGFRAQTTWGPSTRDEIRDYVAADDFEPVVADGLVDPRSLVVEIDRLLPTERTVTYDSGHHHWWPTPFIRVPDERGFVAAQGFQSVGVALGVTLGCAVAQPDRVAVVFIGDGGTLMQLGELDTLIAQRRNAVVVIFNDGAYGAEVHHFEPMGYETDHVRFGVRDLAGVALALGASAAIIRSIDDLAPAIRQWESSDRGTLVLDCRVNPAVRSERLHEAFHAH